MKEENKLVVKTKIEEPLYLACSQLRMVADYYNIDERYKKFIYDIICDMETEMYSNLHKKYGYDICDCYLDLVEILDSKPKRGQLQ